MTGEVSVRFFLPAPPLRRAISTYYVLRIAGTAPLEDLLHPEWANIRLLLTGAWALRFGATTSRATAPYAMVSGALTRTAAGGGVGTMVGVGLLPAGWALLTGRSAADYVDAAHPLADLVGQADVERLLAALLAHDEDTDFCRELDAWFLEKLAAKPPLDPILSEMHLALMDPELATVAEWARRIGRSTRQLERMARDYFGMRPKPLLRRQRFLRTFAAIREQPAGAWGRLIDERYADQPQFVRDFHDFMGMSPRAYFSRSFPFMAAAGDARKALLGAPVQGLHVLDD